MKCPICCGAAAGFEDSAVHGPVDEDYDGTDSCQQRGRSPAELKVLMAAGRAGGVGARGRLARSGTVWRIGRKSEPIFERHDARIEITWGVACASIRTDGAPATKEIAMSSSDDDLSNLIPTAGELLQRSALAEAEKAAEAIRHKAAEEAEKKALLDRLRKPSGVSDEEALKRVAMIIQRAVSNGKTEVQVFRFPNTLCTDGGRAINQQEPGWETTLTGLPKEMYEFWQRHLRPRGYRLLVQIIDFSGGVPGDVGITLKWA